MYGSARTRTEAGETPDEEARAHRWVVVDVVDR